MNWLDVAEKELGVQEVPGSGDNTRILEYHGSTAAGEAPDSVPWCSSFVNWCLANAGIVGTQSKAARSWLRWSGGFHITGSRKGAIVVFQFGEYPSAHVGFELYEWGSDIVVIGGNQSNKVCIKFYPRNLLLARIWPRGVRPW